MSWDTVMEAYSAVADMDDNGNLYAFLAEEFGDLPTREEVRTEKKRIAKLRFKVTVSRIDDDVDVKASQFPEMEPDWMRGLVNNARIRRRLAKNAYHMELARIARTAW